MRTRAIKQRIAITDIDNERHLELMYHTPCSSLSRSNEDIGHVYNNVYMGSGSERSRPFQTVAPISPPGQC
jgi:hypothetical protein